MQNISLSLCSCIEVPSNFYFSDRTLDTSILTFKGHYYARSTLLSPDEVLSWTPLIPGVFGYRSRSGDMFFSPETGKLDTRPWGPYGWFNGNDEADYSLEFAQCTLYYD